MGGELKRAFKEFCQNHSTEQHCFKKEEGPNSCLSDRTLETNDLVLFGIPEKTNGKFTTQQCVTLCIRFVQYISQPTRRIIFFLMELGKETC